ATLSAPLATTTPPRGMFRVNPATRGRSTPIELRRARWGETFAESKRVSTRQNARAAPSCWPAVAGTGGALSRGASVVAEDMKDTYVRAVCDRRFLLYRTNPHAVVAETCTRMKREFIQPSEVLRGEFNAKTSTWKERSACFCPGTRVHGHVFCLWPG